MIQDATTVELNLGQLMYLAAFVWVQLDEDPRDPIALGLFAEVKAAVERLGMVWTYGDPPSAKGAPSERRAPVRFSTKEGRA